MPPYKTVFEQVASMIQFCCVGSSIFLFSWSHIHQTSDREERKAEVRFLLSCHTLCESANFFRTSGQSNGAHYLAEFSFGISGGKFLACTVVA